MSKILLHLLGGIEVKRVTDGVECAINLQSKRTGILAYLAMTKASAYQRRDSIIGTTAIFSRASILPDAPRFRAFG